MGRLKKGEFFNPLEVIQWIFPQDWKHFIPELNEEVEKLMHEGEIQFAEDGETAFPLDLEKNTIRIKTKR